MISLNLDKAMIILGKAMIIPSVLLWARFGLPVG